MMKGSRVAQLGSDAPAWLCPSGTKAQSRARSGFVFLGDCVIFASGGCEHQCNPTNAALT